MLDFKTEIVTTLSPIINTYYAEFVNSSMTIPCVTYKEYMNTEDRTRGQKLLFSTVGYQLKVWCKSVEDLTDYCSQIDLAMNNLGYTRVGSQEVVDTSLMCKVLLYTAYCDEHLD